MQKILEAHQAQEHNFKGAKIPVPTHWNLDLLDKLLADYEDREVGWVFKVWVANEQGQAPRSHYQMQK